MKQKWVPAMVPLAVTLIALWGLLVVDPFRSLTDVLAKVGADADRRGALISLVYRNPLTQEISNGAKPLDSLRKLENEWCGAGDRTRFVLIGNSQTLTVLLAPHEKISGREERTYPDLLIERLQAAGSDVKGYRLSAPNISYMEVLWYLHFLLNRPCLIPKEIVVQLNFETFRKTNIREGMLELLSEPAFAAAVEAEARSSTPYAATFQQAIDRYKSRRAKENGAETGAAPATNTGVSESHGVGGPFETRVRQILDRSSTFRARARLRGEFMDALYLARVHLLGIKPTTKRSIGGATLMLNVSSLERVGELCRQHGIRIAFFNAPQNPSAPLYRTDEDRRRYQQIVNDLAKRYAWRYFDFEDSVPNDMWGVWIDGPDPIHFGRAAHHRMADLMFRAGLIVPEN